MKFSTKPVSQAKEILYNDHYVGIPYDCSEVVANENGVIEAGTIIPANDDTAIGVLLSDVVKAENPNGTIVIHGFVKTSALPEAPTEDETTEGVTTLGAKSVLKQISFM